MPPDMKKWNPKENNFGLFESDGTLLQSKLGSSTSKTRGEFKAISPKLHFRFN